MTPEERTVVRLQFQALISRLNGLAFQEFFSRLMGLARPDFSPVKPQGNEGDWKNDGHEPNCGRYYQVYAPEIYEEAAAIKKIETDFAGLKSKWTDGAVYPIGVREFFFVINDAYRITPGVYPTTYATLARIRQLNGLDVARPMLSKDLEAILFEMPDDKIWSLLGFPPDPAKIRVLRLDHVSAVVRHIVENPIPRMLDETLIAPDFELKIRFNGLTVAAGWLRAADYRRGTVEEYFEAQGNFIRQTVRDKLSSLYEDAKSKGFHNIPSGATIADQQFDLILNAISPRPDLPNARLQKELQDAAIVVMAYFFESCDLFEEPS